MSVTEWIYNKYSSDENGLQESKNFVLIWGLFESQIKSCIGNLRSSDFVSWVQVLEIKKERNGISIKEPSTHKYINTELIGYINNAFNHFFQKYTNDRDKFIDHLYNQTDSQTQKAKKEFMDFVKSLNKQNIKDKIIFLFHIARRMRNKFFHGIKKVGEIISEQKEFEKINRYLVSIISLIEHFA